MTDKSIFLDLVEITQQTKEANNLRYILACSILDEKGSGFVDLATTTPFLANLFQVSTRTVKNRFWKLQDKGWGNIDKKKNRFYYRSQEHITGLLGGEVRRKKAVQVTLNDLAGDIVQTRAFFEACTLAGNPRIVARQTRKEKISGTSRFTQLKYEKINGVQKEYNYGILDGYSDHNLHRCCELNGLPGFRVHDIKGHHGEKGKEYVARQLPNTYFSPIEVCRKSYKSKQSCRNAGRDNVKYERLYYNSFEGANKKYQDTHTVYYRVKEESNILNSMHPISELTGKR